MPRPAQTLEGASIILVGAFNPAILQPRWLATVGLIAETEVSERLPLVVTRDVAQFSTEVFDVQMIPEQFSVSSSRAHHDLVRDFVVGVLSELPHTPVQRMGINREAHYAIATHAEWDAIGRRLAPEEHWTSFLTNPGMRSLTVQGERTDKRKGLVLVRVEPSLRFPQNVFIQHNDHIELVEDGTGEAAYRVLIDVWTESMQRADEAFLGLLQPDEASSSRNVGAEGRDRR